MDRAQIDRFLAGGAAIRAAVAGLTDADLDAFPVPGTWSIRQIVVHVLDSDLIATHRMKRVVAEENPLLLPYDETKFAAALFYEGEPLGEVLDLFDLNRRQMGRILRRLPDAAFARSGVHAERGKVTLAQFVDIYVNHVDHHLGFVARKRGLLGKPLPEKSP